MKQSTKIIPLVAIMALPILFSCKKETQQLTEYSCVCETLLGENTVVFTKKAASAGDLSLECSLREDDIFYRGFSCKIHEK